MVRLVSATAIIAFLVLCALSVQQIQAFEFSADERFTLPVSDTVSDDLYVTCGGAQMTFGSEGGGPGGAFIDGTVLGDLCLAGGAYHFTGEVVGNLNSCSQRATLRGLIHNSARLAGQWITVDGEIGRDVVIFASEAELGSSSVVKRDVSIMGGEVSINGEIGRNAMIFSDQVIISGTIGGDVTIEAQSVTIVAPAEIKGDIKYSSPRELKIDDDVIVHGEIDWNETEKDANDSDDPDYIFQIILFFCSLTTGLILIPLFRHHALLTVEQIKTNPIPSLGVGFVFLFAAPFAIALLIVTIIGIPSAMILLFAYTTFFYIAKIYTSIALGELIVKAFRKDAAPKMSVSLIIGLIMLSLLFQMPFIGWIVYFLTIFFGLGGLLRGLHKCRQSMIPNISTLEDPENRD